MPHDTAIFLFGTTDCAHLARFAVENNIEGPDFIAAQLLDGQGVLEIEDQYSHNFVQTFWERGISTQITQLPMIFTP